MVLKMCAGLSTLWGATASSSPSPSTASSKELKLRALELLVTDSHDTKWEKEFRVFFDGTKPTGLGFQPCQAPQRQYSTYTRSSITATSPSVTAEQLSSDPGDAYTCRVSEVVPGGLADEYNYACRSAGDYSRIIVENLRVRKVNHEDLAGMPFDAVVAKMQAARPAFFLTFVDVNSKPTRLDQEESESTQGAPRVVRHRQSTIGSGAGMLSKKHLIVSDGGSNRPGNQRRSMVAVVNDMRRRSSLVGMLGTSTVHSDEDSIQEVTKKNIELVEQIKGLKERIVALESENSRLEAQGHAAKERGLEEVPVAETRPSQTVLNTQDEAAPNEHLSAEHETALEELRRNSQRFQIEAQQTSTKCVELEGALKGQQQLLEEKTKYIEQIEHEKDELSLQLKELIHEHEDMHKHADELHDRLVQAQTEARETKEQLERVLVERDSYVTELEYVKRTIVADSEESAPSELQRLIGKEGPAGSVSATQVPVQDLVQMFAKLKEEKNSMGKQRDELAIEVSCLEHNIDDLKQELQSTKLKNEELQNALQSLRAIEKQYKDREERLRSETNTQLEQAQNQHRTERAELEERIQSLQRQCDASRAEKDGLQVALSSLENKARSRVESYEKEKEFLTQFKQALAKGIPITKYGARGNPHPRLLFSDPQCRWIAWGKVGASQSLSHPKDGNKSETIDIVGVIAGAKSEVFMRQRPEAPTACFSLVLAHPCRTLDIQAESTDRCQYLVRGFRLLHQEASEKRQ